MAPTTSEPILEIDSSDPLPGFVSWQGGRFSWHGPNTWTVRHGEAKAFRIAGCLAWVEGALSQSGKTGRVVPGDPAAETWRRQSEDGTWVHGNLTLANDGATFVEHVTPPPGPKWTKGSLPDDLAECPPVMEALADYNVASSLYAALCGNLWKKRKAPDRDYTGGWLKAAQIVTALRGRGEVPDDFLMAGDEGQVSSLAADLMKEAGWRLSGKARGGRPDMKQARRLLEICAPRPMTPAPIWFGAHAFGLILSPLEIEAIAHETAYSGRMEFHEWCAFWERFAFQD